MLSTSSNALWGHILPLHSRRDTSTTRLPPSDASTTRPSMHPVQDRNTTSLRVLLNSTEMSLQKFSSRVDELVLGVGEAKAEVKHAGNLLDAVGDRVVGDFTSILNRMQGRIVEIVREPAQQTTLQALVAEHKAMSTKVDLMQLQLETFMTQQATLQASINALQPLVLAAERLSTRLDSFESTTTNALAKLEGLVVEMAENLEDIKNSRSIRRITSSNTPKKRHSSVSPPPSPEFPPLKRRKFDLGPSSPEIIPSSQPDNVAEDDSVEGPTSSARPASCSLTALPLLRPTPFTPQDPPTQAEYELNNQISPVPTPCPPGKQKANTARSHSSRPFENTYRMVNASQVADPTEYPRARVPPGLEIDGLRKTSHQAISPISTLSPPQPCLRASVETSNVAQPIPTTAALAFQFSFPAIPPYVQTILKPKLTRRTIKLDSDGEESQNGMVGQTWIDMLADL